ncbi:MAG: DUF4430 domain-containing protein [Thermoplasmata archaeon]|nr:MAG: DUF4430 domain-containing protein [Thermoplasmata archaeon]
MKENRDRKKTAFQAIALVSVLALAAFSLWLLAEHLEEGNVVGDIDTPINVSLKIDGGEWMLENMNVQTLNNTVYKFLIECSEKFNFIVGYIYWQGYDSIFVTSINGTENGENGLWWQYYVNGAYGEVGCDKKEIFDGDLVEWRFEEPMQ